MSVCLYRLSGRGKCLVRKTEGRIWTVSESLHERKGAAPRRRQSRLRRDHCMVSKRRTLGRIELEISESTCRWLLAGACRRVRWSGGCISGTPRAPEQPPDGELWWLRGVCRGLVCIVIFCSGGAGSVQLLNCRDLSYRAERDRLRYATGLELLAAGELSVGECFPRVLAVGWL